MQTGIPTETRDFLNALFAGCPSGYLTLTAIHPDGLHRVPSRHVALGDAAALDDGLARLLAANARGWGAYFAVATRKTPLGRWGRGGRDDLEALPALFVDIDDAGATTRLAWFDLPPTWVVASGRGYHAYWLLEQPATDWAQAELVLTGLAQRLGGDGAITVAHSMRLPGSANTKPAREGALCRIERAFPDRRYRLGDFAPFITPPRIVYQRRAWASPAVPDEERAWRIAAVTEAVLEQLDGRWKGNGFIAARCPYCHQRDRTGMHFSYDPRTGVGRCFGKHGRIGLRELGDLLGLAARAG